MFSTYAREVTARISKQGNSAVVVLAVPILKLLAWNVGDLVLVTPVNDGVMLSRLDLSKLAPSQARREEARRRALKARNAQ